jgi:pentatricopeptide repeat protein
MLKFDGLFDVWWLGVGCLGSLVQNYVQRGDWELARKMFFRMLNLERLLKAVFDVEHAASLFDVERTASSLETGELSEFPWREPNDNLIDGYLDCVKVMNSIDKVYGYALTVIDLTPGPSPDCFAMLATSACGEASGRKVQIRIGYDDYVTVWLNGKKLLETTGGSPCIYDDVIVDATLQPGQNRLLVKIGNIEPGWGFLVRITNANGVTFDNLSYASPIAKA